MRGRRVAGIVVLGLMLFAGCVAAQGRPDLVWMRGGHLGVADVAYFPDGKTFLSGASDHTVKVWRVSDGMLLRTLICPNEVRTVACAPNGKTFAAGTRDGWLLVWRTSDGQLLQSIQAHSYDLLDLAFAPDSQTLASAGWDTKVRIWNPLTGTLLRELLQPGPVFSIAYSPDGAFLAAAPRDNPVRLWRLTDGALVQQFPGLSRPPVISFSPDGLLLAGVSDTATLLWRVQDGSVVRQLQGLSYQQARSTAFSPDGQVLAIGVLNGFSGFVKLWRISDGVLLPVTGTLGTDLQVVTFAPGGETLAVATSSQVELRHMPDLGVTASLLRNRAPISAVAVSPDGQMVATGSLSGMINLQRIQDGELIRSWSDRATGSPPLVYGLAFLPDGQSLASCGDGGVNLWRVSDGALLRAYYSGARAVAVSPDGSMIAADVGRNVIQVWRVSDGVPLTGRMEVPIVWPYQVMSLAFSPDGKSLIAGSQDGEGVRIWHVGDWTTTDPPIRNGPSLSFSPDSHSLAVGHANGNIDVWSLPDFVPLGTLSGHTAAVTSIAYSPLGQTLASLSEDGTLRFWDTENGRLLSTYDSEAWGAVELKYSPDEKYLLYGRADGSVGCVLNPFHTVCIPSHGGNTGNVTVKVITSLNVPLAEGAAVTITGSGFAPLAPISSKVETPFVMTATFDLRGAPLGKRDVVVSTPGGGERTYSQVFEVKQTIAAKISVSSLGWSSLRSNVPQRGALLVQNEGNVDEPPAHVALQFPNALLWSLDPGWLFDVFVGENSTSLTTDTEPMPAGSTATIPGISLRAPGHTLDGQWLQLSEWIVPDELPHVINVDDHSGGLSVRLVSVYHRSLECRSLVNSNGAHVIRLTAYDGNGNWATGDVNSGGYVTGVTGSNGSQIQIDWPSPTTGIATPIPPSGQPGDSFTVNLSNAPATVPDLPKNSGCINAAAVKIVLLAGCVAYTAIQLIEVLDYDPFSKLVVGLLLEGIRDELCDKAVDLVGDWLEDHSGCESTYVISSSDPNDLSGPTGYGPEKWLPASRPVTYDVMFENVPTATAPAATVVVTDHIDATKFDTTSVQIQSISFAGHTVAPTAEYALPVGQREFTKDEPMPEKGLICRVHCKLDMLTGDLTWTFTTIDPATGQPLALDDTRGFLAPGAEGSCLFSVLPKPDLATGTVVTNQASIVFDFNDPMNTPVWSNTIDNDIPTSAVLKLAPTQKTSKFTVKWAGADVGSGLKDYTVSVSTDNGPYEVWLANTTATSAAFTGVGGHSYRFYSAARDNAGNVEAVPDVADATTTVVLCVDNVKVLPNPLAGSLPATGTVTLTGPAPTGGAVVLISSSSGNVQPQPSVTVPEGQTVATFPVTTTAVTTTTTVTISATWKAIKKTTQLKVRPIAPAALTFNPTSFKPTKTTIGTVTLEAPAAPGSVTVQLKSDNAILTVPQSITIPQGATTGTFTAQAGTTTTAVTAKVTASTGGGSKTVSLKVLANGVVTLVLSPNTVQGGADSTATITPDAPATASTTVTLSSSNASVAWFVDGGGTPIAGATIPVGQQSVQVRVRTAVMAVSTKVTLKAAANGVTKSAALTVKP